MSAHLIVYYVAVLGVSVLIGVHGSENGWSIVRSALTAMVASTVLFVLTGCPA